MVWRARGWLRLSLEKVGRALARREGLARIRVARLYWHFPDRVYDGERRIRSIGPATGGRLLLWAFPARPLRRSSAAGYRRTPDAARQMDEGARLRIHLPGEPAARLHLSQTGSGHLRRLGPERAKPSPRPVRPACWFDTAHRRASIAGPHCGHTINHGFGWSNVTVERHFIRQCCGRRRPRTDHSPTDSVTGHDVSPRDSHAVSWRVSQFGGGLRRCSAGTQQPKNLECPSGGLRV